MTRIVVTAGFIFALMPSVAVAACNRYIAAERADTARCFLSVDGKAIIQEYCHVVISPGNTVSGPGHVAGPERKNDPIFFYMDNGRDRAQVNLRIPDQAILHWNGDSLGEVGFDYQEQDGFCYRNRRATMCMHDFMLCGPSR